LDSGDVPEGTNLYYTDGRVTAHSDVSASTAHRANTSNPHGVTKTQLGLENVTNTLHKLDAVAAPTINDDSNSGYTVGSVWINITSDQSYICTDSTDNDAVWVNTTVTQHNMLDGVGTNTHAQIDTHIADTTIHFTEASIDHTNIQNVGINDHGQIDAHIDDSTVHFTKSSISHGDLLNTGTNTHTQLDSHVADATLHFTKSSIDHSDLQNIGINTHAQIDSHIANASTHFTEASVDHSNIQNCGLNTHAQIDTHIADPTLHFTKSSISHNDLQDKGINTHTQIDSHIADFTFHFTKGSISHDDLQDKGTNTHTQIDSHIANNDLHRTINDTGTALTDLWSASKIDIELGGKSDTGHTHPSSDITDFNTQADARISLQKGAANGLATLDGNSKIPITQLPALAVTSVSVVANIAARDALTPDEGDVCKVTDAGSGYPETYIWDGTSWIDFQESSDVISVNGQAGVVSLTTTDVSEGTNLYYTEARVSANTSVATNTAHGTLTNNPHSVTKVQVGLSNVANTLHKLDAIGAPTVNDDSSSGYSVSSLWVNLSNDRVYICTDATSTAAVWRCLDITDHVDLDNVGSNTHAQIDSHISDASTHFTEASIDHNNIQNKGTNTHTQIDTHIADTLASV